MLILQSAGSHRWLFAIVIQGLEVTQSLQVYALKNTVLRERGQDGVALHTKDHRISQHEHENNLHTVLLSANS